MPPTAPAPPRPDWGLSPSPAGPASAFILPAISAAGAVVLLGAATTWVIGLLVAAVLFGAWAVLIVTTGSRILGSVGARPPQGDEVARIGNILDGLGSGSAPELLVIDDQEPNALVTWSKGPKIAVTTGLAGTFTRTECEAVIAHCLARVRSGEARTTTYLLGAGLPKPPPVGTPHDVSAVAITRYPPGLSAALSRCSTASGRWAAVWLAGEPPAHMPTSERISALADL